MLYFGFKKKINSGEAAELEAKFVLKTNSFFLFFIFLVWIPGNNLKRFKY